LLDHAGVSPKVTSIIMKGDADAGTLWEEASMYRLWAWWKARVDVGGPGSALLRFALFFAIPVVLVVILAIVAGAVISGH
jgi:hypothetical protein